MNRAPVLILAVLFSSLLFPVASDGENLRFRYLGSTCISLPTAYSRAEASYISDDSHNLSNITVPILGRFLECSMLRHLNGDLKDKNVLNLKVTFMDEGRWFPSLAWGLSDFNRVLGSRIFFIAGSKTVEMFGTTVHAGVFKDPVKTEKEVFFGLEKMVFPLVTVAGERINDKTTLGLKIRPYPGISFEYARRGNSFKEQQSIYKVSYLRSF